eukprot:TRINITY_DN61331_c0_g1_i1.p1 TRINITY_DN61331_c0_g1~~TRINITY_DN61331_c0_g1_i1.p1  ORF type:complete len:474 (-),score=58.18 TRINITY_DN61331_c0_g1_i1:1184-2581(-)
MSAAARSRSPQYSPKQTNFVSHKPPLLEGVLKKEGIPTSLFGVTVRIGWKDRYCILHENQMQFYPEKPKSDTVAPQGVIDLYKVVVSDLAGLKFSLGGEHLAKTHTFEASTPAQKDEWLKHLRGQKKHEVSIADFRLLCFIGEGGWGKVYKVEAKESKKIFAMKVIEKRKLQLVSDIECTMSEKFFLQEFDHPFIVHLHYTFQTTDKLFLIMDYLAGGDAYYLLMQNDSFSEDVVRQWTAEIAMALEYLHKNNVIYRDLKPENCVLDHQGYMVLTDFGLSKRAEGGRRKTKVGTPDYMPPEMVMGKEYTAAADYWSLGCFTYEMIVGNHPFQTGEGAVPEWKVLNDDPEFPEEMSEEAKELITRMLEKDPDKRLQKLEEIRAFKWFAELDWDKLYSKDVEPIFLPNPNDEENFDPEYTQQRPILRPTEPGEDFADFAWDAEADATDPKEKLKQQAAEDGLGEMAT